MDDALLVRVVNGAGQRFDQCRSLNRRKGTLAQPVLKRGSGDILQHEKGLVVLITDFQDLDNIGMAQPCRRERLSPESLAGRGIAEVDSRQDLQSDMLIEPLVDRLVNDSHAAAPQATNNSIFVQMPRERTGGGCQRGLLA